MRQSKTRSAAIIIISIVILGLLFWLIPTKPGEMLSNKKLIDMIHAVVPELEDSDIQDVIYVDDKHVFVPFTTKGNQYGISCWVWKKHKWNLTLVDSSGEPRIWKLDPNDPSSFHLIWNLNPKYPINEIHYYFIRDRWFVREGNVEKYFPRIQLEHKMNFKSNSYGALQFADKWSSVMGTLAETKSSDTNDAILDDFLFNEDANMVEFGWIPYNHLGTSDILEESLAGYSFREGSEEFELVKQLTEAEIE
ncbi:MULTISPECIES: hypothetical protein [Bacillus]|uniref:hypothetical protein n=1 Tax=Bacillus TaxID=1386 RepID=UPI0002F822DB|nr:MULTISPECIES: hypothetical protein [Bacillus]